MAMKRTAVDSFDAVRRVFDWLLPIFWQPFDCDWATASSAPAIGNGSIVAYYQTEGPLCRVSLRLTAGSSTTFGTGAWTFTMPVHCVAGVAVVGSVVISDASTQFYSGTCVIEAGTNGVTPVTYEGAVTGTSPQAAWATGDTLTLTIEYPYRNG